MKRWQRGHRADLLPYALWDISNYYWRSPGWWCDPFLQSTGQLPILPWGFSSTVRSMNLHSSPLICVICLLFLQHKPSGSCGGELVSGATAFTPLGFRDCCSRFCVFFLYLWNVWVVSSRFFCGRCFLSLYFRQWFILLLHYIYLEAIVTTYFAD